jgi:UDP-N-acetylglucosamine transferase subunit ALG13
MNKYQTRVAGIKKDLLESKPVEEVTKIEKRLVFTATSLAERLDDHVNRIAKNLANAKYDKMSADTNKDYEKANQEYWKYYDMAVLLNLVDEVNVAGEHYYNEIVKQFGNPTNKYI